MKTKRFTVEVTVLALAERTFIAVGQVGGASVRGKTGQSQLEACQNLFFAFKGDNDDANIGMAVAMENTTLDAAMLLAAGETGDTTK